MYTSTSPEAPAADSLAVLSFTVSITRRWAEAIAPQLANGASGPLDDVLSQFFNEIERITKHLPDVEVTAGIWVIGKTTCRIHCTGLLPPKTVPEVVFCIFKASETIGWDVALSLEAFGMECRDGDSVEEILDRMMH